MKLSYERAIATLPEVAALLIAPFAVPEGNQTSLKRKRSLEDVGVQTNLPPHKDAVGEPNQLAHVPATRPVPNSSCPSGRTSWAINETVCDFDISCALGLFKERGSNAFQ